MCAVLSTRLQSMEWVLKHFLQESELDLCKGSHSGSAVHSLRQTAPAAADCVLVVQCCPRGCRAWCECSSTSARTWSRTWTQGHLSTTLISSTSQTSAEAADGLAIVQCCPRACRAWSGCSSTSGRMWSRTCKNAHTAACNALSASGLASSC